MSSRSTLRTTFLAAAATLAGFGAWAIEAEQWNPQAAATPVADAVHAAWATQLGEATQFHDAVTRDTMTSRADVKSDLRTARARGLLDDTGEAGASDRVLAQREAYVQEEHDRILALNTQAEDPIADMIYAMSAADGWSSDGAYAPDSVETLSMAGLMPEDARYQLPTDQQDRPAL